MNIILHDNKNHFAFAPLTLTKPLGKIRMGILTCEERWKAHFPEAKISFITEKYLEERFSCQLEESNIIINAAVIASKEIAEWITQLIFGQTLVVNDIIVATCGTELGEGEVITKHAEEFLCLSNRWDIYQKNDIVLKADFDLVTKNRNSQILSNSNTLIGDSKDIFLEEGAKVEASILNTTNGPIYIGYNAEIMEGSVVRGGLAMCEASALKLSTKIYGATTLGPHCKVGGEVNNCVFQAYSNKGHDGFLGNSLIGEWCNLGADTNSSNLKNNYGKVKTYSYVENKLVQTDVQFMGLTMGDHSKCGINTMFNTATVVGVSSNIFGADFPDKMIGDFMWGGGNTWENFNFNKAMEVAENMMGRRGVELLPEDKTILKYLFDKSY